MLKMIWAQTNEGIIGKNNQLPWKIKEELRHFKTTTLNHTIVMGRKTFESIGKPLPNRKNVVLSRNRNLKIPGVEVINEKEIVLNLAKSNDVFVIGGKQIYDIFYDDADMLIISFINNNYPGDTKLSYNMNGFSLVKEEEYDDFVIKTFIRKE